MNRLVKMFLVVPAMGMLWGAANSTGATEQFARSTGLDIPTNFKIPGLEQVLNANDQVEGAKRTARQAAVRALRQEVRERYGDEVANRVPRDLTIGEAARITKAVASGASAPDIQALLRDPGLPKVPGGGGGGGGEKSGSAPDAVTIPYMTQRDYDRARKDLATLVVRGKGSMTGYSRDEYGAEWDDDAGDFSWTDNGCDTRNDVLKRDLVKVTYDGGDKCDVETGVVRYERYTGKKNVVFDAGDSDYSTDLDIEHVVALGNVWVSGGSSWSESKRASVANDPMNLFAADPSSNRQKGDSDASAWLPSNKPYRCAYISQQVAVKAKYGLSVTSSEKDAMSRVLSSCTG